MADFSTYVKNVTIVPCSRMVTLTMNGAVKGGDIITFPMGTLWVSEVSANGYFQPVDNILTLSKVIEGDTVTMMVPLSDTPYLIEYHDKGEGSSYFEPIYLDCEGESCDDCYSCDYINNGRLYNKKIKGLLTHSRYSDNHPQYMLDFVYDENDPKSIKMNDSALNLDSVNHPIDGSLFSKFLILTYISFDQDSGKFAEQIVYSSGINKDVVGVDGFENWTYEIQGDPWKCWLHNGECIETTVEDDYTNATIIVEYIGDNNTDLTTTQTYPLLWTKRLDSENGSKFVDGVYKSYYFMVRDVTAGFSGYTIPKGNVVRFKDVFGTDSMDYVLRANEGYNITTTSTEIVLSKLGTSETLTVDSSNLELLLGWFTQVEGLLGAEDDELIYQPIEMMKSINDLRCGEIEVDSVLQEIIAEEMHIITYELAYEVLKSIEDCSVPCERFSFDEWMGLRQKHLSANTNFCKGNIMKAALDLYTSRKRCKNC